MNFKMFSLLCKYESQDRWSDAIHHIKIKVLQNQNNKKSSHRGRLIFDSFLLWMKFKTVFPQLKIIKMEKKKKKYEAWHVPLCVFIHFMWPHLNIITVSGSVRLYIRIRRATSVKKKLPFKIKTTQL